MALSNVYSCSSYVVLSETNGTIDISVDQFDPNNGGLSIGTVKDVGAQAIDIVKNEDIVLYRVKEVIGRFIQGSTRYAVVEAKNIILINSVGAP